MTTRQNENNAFPKWFQQAIWFAGVVVAIIVYDAARYSVLKADIAVLQTEVADLKKKYAEDIKDILKKTDEIVTILNKHEN